jgi:plasmid maintenance system antidote protein VapI
MSDVNHILQMVAQHAALERQLQPVMPQISAKLVSDLLATGTPAAKIAKVIGRKPSYVQAIANGDRSLSSQLIVKLIQSQATSAQENSNASQE